MFSRSDFPNIFVKFLGNSFGVNTCCAYIRTRAKTGKILAHYLCIGFVPTGSATSTTPNLTALETYHDTPPISSGVAKGLLQGEHLQLPMGWGVGEELTKSWPSFEKLCVQNLSLAISCCFSPTKSAYKIRLARSWPRVGHGLPTFDTKISVLKLQGSSCRGPLAMPIFYCDTSAKPCPPLVWKCYLYHPFVSRYHSHSDGDTLAEVLGSGVGRTTPRVVSGDRSYRGEVCTSLQIPNTLYI